MPTLRVAALCLVISVPALADDAEVARCAPIVDPAARLRCYDALAAGANTQTDDATRAGATTPLGERLRREREGRKLLLTPLRPTYAIHTYSAAPNQTPSELTEPDARLQHHELKFQFSFRLRLADDVFGDNGDFWFGYTQLSFWQAYNSSLSSPFRETNYEPELGLSFNTDFDVLGLRNRIFTLGFAHHSNGRSEPLSRSWNRLWTSLVLERGNFVLQLRPWYRIPEDAADDDNPDIENFYGRGEILAGYKDGEYLYSLLLRNNFRTHDNRSGVELDWTFPIGKRVRGLLQFYTGYGESLIDYNVRTQRLGIGFLVADWL